MKLSLKALTLSILTTALAGTALMTDSATAQPVRFEGSYVGAGVAGSVTGGGAGDDNPNFGGNVQGRLAVPKTPVSVRGTVLFNGNNSAVIPTVTYDMGVAKNTNVYAGAGYSFVQNDGTNSPIGNRDTAVLNLGIESQVTKGVVVYGDAKYGIKGYESGKPSVGLSAGVGVQF
ncbi:MAG: autotransporter outer membrane beta-barrel domain-containing protein [Synechococcales bacterium]|nr:autotransporter outer membrane beta-barrel domain-containing protein [Synechococcales bacterium]